MAYALVSHLGAQLGANGGTSGSLNTTASDLLIVVCAFDGFGGTGLSLSDSKTNTWTAITPDQGGAYYQALRIYYAKNPTVGTGHTFSFGSTGSAASMYIGAFSGADLTLPKDQQNGNAQDAVTSLATGSITPTTDNQLVVAGLATPDPTTVGIGGSFTIAGTAAAISFQNEGSTLAYLIQTTATAANPTWTSSVGMALGTTIVSFKSAAAAAQDTPELYARPRDRRMRQILAQ